MRILQLDWKRQTGDERDLIPVPDHLLDECEKLFQLAGCRVSVIILRPRC